MGSPLSPVVANIFMEDWRHVPWKPPPENLRCGTGTSMMFLSSGPMEINAGGIPSSPQRTESLHPVHTRERIGGEDHIPRCTA